MEMNKEEFKSAAEAFASGMRDLVDELKTLKIPIIESEEAEVKKDIGWLRNKIVDYFTIEGNGFDVGGYEILDLFDQLDEPEVLSQEWINKHKREHDDYPSGAPVLLVDDVKEVLVPKLRITEGQAWDLLKEKYEWPWDDLRYAIMQQLEEGTAEAKMTSLGYFEVEVDGIKYHVHEDAHTRIYDEAYEQGRSDLERELKGDLPVIPQYVADFIEENKNSDLMIIMHSFQEQWEDQLHYNEDVSDVLQYVIDNEATFVQAWVGEYKAEKEPEYFIKVNGKYLITINIEDTDSIGRAIGGIQIFYEVGDSVVATSFTKKEVEYIKKYLNVEAKEILRLSF